MVQDFDIAELSWRGFELHPETPVGGVEVARLFPGQRIDSMRAWMQRFAADFGVEMGMPSRMPNTRRALAIAEFARDHGALDAFRDAAMDAHWRHERDLEAPEVLRELAAGAGLDPAAALSAGSDPAYLGRIEAIREEAHQRGVTGIPTLFFGDTPVVGCQPYEVLALVATRVGLRRR